MALLSPTTIGRRVGEDFIGTYVYNAEAHTRQEREVPWKLFGDVAIPVKIADVGR